MSGKQGKEIRGSVRLGPTLSVARSDELFSLPPGPCHWLWYYCWWLSRQTQVQVTAASHAMCDAELASHWPDVRSPELWLAGDMLHDAWQIWSPRMLMTGSGGMDTRTPDMLTHIVTLHTLTINGQSTGSWEEREEVRTNQSLGKRSADQSEIRFILSTIWGEARRYMGSEEDRCRCIKRDSWLKT